MPEDVPKGNLPGIVDTIQAPRNETMTRKARLLLHGKKSATDSWPSADEEPRRGPRVSWLTTRTHSLLYKLFGGEHK